MIKYFSSFLAGSLLLFMLLETAALKYLEFKSASGQWYESPSSKNALLQARKETELVILGTSTAQNNINTAVLNQLGLRAFNFGLPGIYWQDYPFVLEDLLKSGGKEIAISLSLKTLHIERKCPLRHWKSFLSLLAEKRWDCLSDFRPVDFLPLTVELQFLGEGKTSLQKGLKEKFPNESRTINYVRGRPDRKVVTFTNGDGLIVTKGVTETLINTDKFEDISEENLQYLGRLLGQIRSAGKEAILILEARSLIEFPDFDRVAFTAALNKYLQRPVGIIFNHDLKIPPAYWADFSHMNYQGTILYSRLLACQFKLLKSEQSGSCDQDRQRIESVI
jgi:hypothetical protein